MLTDNGIEAVALENNHVMDHGTAGYQDTCDTLAAAGITYSGHLGASTFTTDTGVKIGMLAYQTFNGNYKNIYASIEGDIQALRDAGCALVIVSYHWGDEKDYVPNAVPMGRFAKPEEVGDAVCTLCDPTLSYLTGQTLILDGGLSL